MRGKGGQLLFNPCSSHILEIDGALVECNLYGSETSMECERDGEQAPQPSHLQASGVYPRSERLQNLSPT